MDIDVTLDHYTEDEHGWKSYSLYSYGDSLSELIVNASVRETGKHGEEIATYGLTEAPLNVRALALDKIEIELNKSQRQKTAGADPR